MLINNNGKWVDIGKAFGKRKWYGRGSVGEGYGTERNIRQNYNSSTKRKNSLMRKTWKIEDREKVDKELISKLLDTNDTDN